MVSRTMKILVVDDDPFIREMLSAILQSKDYQVEMAENGSDAIDKFTANPDITLIIADMNMPAMNGLELIKEIRNNNFDVPIIILTGSNEISIAMEAIRSGASDYLLKDQNINSTIILSVEKVLEKYNLRKQNVQLMADLATKNNRMQHEKELAQKVQKNILPPYLDFEEIGIETLYQASDLVGGDFYDAWETKQSIHFVLGDVSGHSIASALLMATCKGMLRSFGQTLDTPIEVVTATNRMLCEIVGKEGMFISLVYVNFIKEKNVIQVLSCGHDPIFLLSGNNVQAIPSTGPVLGWDTDDSWNVVHYPFNPGERLFLYTDGLIEVKNDTGEEFGEDRLLSLLQTAHYNVKDIFQKVAAFCSKNFPDDIEIVTIRKH